MTTGIRVGASASEGRFSLVEEAAWGVMPATPAFKNLRITSENIQASKTTAQSNEVRADRNVTDEILVGRAVAGPIAFELSYATFDDLFESLMFADFATNVLKNGAGVGTSFSAERRIPLPAGGFDYLRFSGLVANTMSLTINSGGLVTGEFGMMGKSAGRSGAIITGATYAEANQNRPMNVSTMFGSLAVEGLANAPRVQGVTLNITNNMRAQTEAGSLDVAGLAPGRFVATGTVRAYFETGLLYQAFLDHTDLSLAFTLGEAAGSRYRFTLPTIVTTGDPGVNIGGNDEDVMATLNFTAVLDRIAPLLGCTVQIEKGV